MGNNNEQLLEMVEKNEINRSLLALLDENIASALSSNQVPYVRFPFFFPPFAVLINTWFVEFKCFRKM